MQKSEAINEIAAALAAAQAEMRSAAFDRANAHLRTRYATLAAIIEVVKPVLAKHGIALLQDVSAEEMTAAVSTLLVHSSGQWIQSEQLQIAAIEQKGITLTQSLGIAITYAKRYSLASFLSVVADDDNDGNGEAVQQKPVQDEFNRLKIGIETAPSEEAMAAYLERNQTALTSIPEEKRVILRESVKARRDYLRNQ